jgi:hypothetical protein
VAAAVGRVHVADRVDVVGRELAVARGPAFVLEEHDGDLLRRVRDAEEMAELVRHHALEVVDAGRQIRKAATSARTRPC